MAIANAFNRSGGTGDDTGTIEIVFEDLTSSVNGERTQFATSSNYEANTLAVYINGLRQRQSTIGQVGLNTFTVPEAPENGDILEVRYEVTPT